MKSKIKIVILIIIFFSLIFLKNLIPIENKKTNDSEANKTTISIPEGSEFKDVVYKKVNNKDIVMDIYSPTKWKYKNSPVIMYIHGGSWAYGDKKLDDNIMPALNKIRDEGFTIISINYRLASDDIKFPLPVEDCKDAVRWIYKNSKDYNFDVENIGLWGISAGSHLALLTAYSSDKDFKGDDELFKYPSKVKYVIDYCGPTNFVLDKSKDINKEINEIVLKFIGKDNMNDVNILKMASPINYLNEISPKTLIVHGENDKVVPISQSIDLYEKGKGFNNKIQLIKVENADHDLFNIGYMNMLKIAKSTLDFIKENTDSK